MCFHFTFSIANVRSFRVLLGLYDSFSFEELAKLDRVNSP